MGWWLHVVQFLFPLSDDSQKVSVLQDLPTMTYAPAHIRQMTRINILSLINIITISHVPTSLISYCIPSANAASLVIYLAQYGKQLIFI